MNFDLTDEQQMLADTAREMFSRSYDTESRNKAVDSDLGWSREVWKQLAEIGILGLGFDPDEAGPIEVMAVMTEIGRRLAPEPVAAAALIPGAVIAAHGSDAQRALLDDVAAGDRLLAFAHTESGGRGSPELATRATEQGGSWTLTGRKTPVLAGDSADVLVVTAALPGGGSGLFLVDGDATTRQPFRTFDGQRGADIEFAGAAAQLCKQATVAAPEVALGWYNLGIAERQRGHLPAATSAYRRALALDPSYAEAQQNLAVALLLSGDIEGAREGFRQAIGLLSQQGRTQEAEALHQQASTLVKLDT
jgi:alkylation response protein AidB-like acyl-CoA dehydrogenase